jgi:hypothetical protein
MATRQRASRRRKDNRPATTLEGNPSRSRKSVPGPDVPTRATHTLQSADRRRRTRKRKTSPSEHVYGVPVPEGLHEAIETERGNLSKAESLLGCLAISMEYDTDPATSPYYPDVAQIARDLVRQSLNGLDSLVLQRHLLRNKVKEETELLIAGRARLILGPADSQGPADSHETSVCEYLHLPQRAIALLAAAY